MSAWLPTERLSDLSSEGEGSERTAWRAVDWSCCTSPHTTQTFYQP